MTGGSVSTEPRHSVDDVAAHLEHVRAELRADQHTTTQVILEQLLWTPTGVLQALALDRQRRSAVLVVDGLVIRAAVETLGQSLELQEMHRAAPTVMIAAGDIGEGRVLLGFSDGDRAVAFVAETLCWAH